MMRTSVILLLPLLFYVTDLKAQDVVEFEGNEDKSYQMYAGFTTNYLSIRRGLPFGLWRRDRRSRLPDNRRGTNRSSFSITPHFGVQLNETFHLGFAFDHRSHNQRTTLIEEDGDLEIDFSSNRNLNGLGFFSRIIINPKDNFQVYVRPSVLYYFENYEEFRDSRTDLVEKDRFLLIGFGMGGQYAINDNLRLVVRLSGINYVTGSWKESGTNRGESYSEFSSNLRRSGLFAGLEWTF